MKTEKKLVVLTLILAVIMFAFIIYFNKNPENVVAIDTSKQPSLGNVTAAVQVVAFESLRCPHCKHYMETIYPNLKKQYIDSGKIQYTPILIVTVVPDSATEAAYCIYKQNHEAFFNFIDLCYKNFEEGKTWTINRVLSMASQLPTINLVFLQQCLDEGEFSKNVFDNNELIGKTASSVPALMKAGVPALFVNGIYVESLTKENLFRLIDAQLLNVTLRKNK